MVLWKAPRRSQSPAVPGIGFGLKRNLHDAFKALLDN
jgi:hypothetical protein